MARKSFQVNVRIADFETFVFMDYSNKFYNYRMANVWSSPECLENIKHIPENMN